MGLLVAAVPWVCSPWRSWAQEHTAPPPTPAELSSILERDLRSLELTRGSTFTSRRTEERSEAVNVQEPEGREWGHTDSLFCHMHAV